MKKCFAEISAVKAYVCASMSADTLIETTYIYIYICVYMICIIYIELLFLSVLYPQQFNMNIYSASKSNLGKKTKKNVIFICAYDGANTYLVTVLHRFISHTAQNGQIQIFKVKIKKNT